MNSFEQALTAASTDEQAAVAASDVLDDLIPGGAAISIDAAELIVDVVDAFTSDHRHESFVLAVMIDVARCLGAWQRVLAPSETVRALVAAEGEVHRVLLDFLRSHTKGLVSDKPDVRSLLYRLTGIVADPDAAVEYIRQSLGAEESPLARACAYEGLAVAVMRGPARLTDETVLLRNAIQSDAVVASRVANAPYDYVGQGSEANLQKLEKTLAVALPDRDYGNFWPSELL